MRACACHRALGARSLQHARLQFTLNVREGGRGEAAWTGAARCSDGWAGAMTVRL
jgi:hypothetical protein